MKRMQRQAATPHTPAIATASTCARAADDASTVWPVELWFFVRIWVESQGVPIPRRALDSIPGRAGGNQR